MTRHVVTYFPHNPLPPRSGAHRRFLEVVGGLCELGCRVSFLSSTLFRDSGWTPDAPTALRAAGFDEVRVHVLGPADYAFVGPSFVWHRLRRQDVPLDSVAFRPPRLRAFFTRSLDELRPDLLLMNYAYNDGLVAHDRLTSVVRAVDSLDMVTLQGRLRRKLAAVMPGAPASADDVAEEVLREDFFDDVTSSPGDLEFAVYDRYDVTLAISRREADLIGRASPHTQVLYLPVTCRPVSLANDYSGPALFVAGDNPFNRQGYYYLVRRVLPLVRRRHPEFVLRLVGPLCQVVPPAEGVERAGFVPELAPVYAPARFSVNPVFGGTGQHIKVVESMAHGVPVVCVSAMAHSSPVRDGENGLVTTGPEAMAEAIGRLWIDGALCRRLGQAARDTVDRECSRPVLLEGLNRLLAVRPRKAMQA